MDPIDRMLDILLLSNRLGNRELPFRAFTIACPEATMTDLPKTGERLDEIAAALKANPQAWEWLRYRYPLSMVGTLYEKN